ncbi:MAG: diguanylate cyclase [Chloroflexaceae bacterium]|nr:diguanylate cyclase [Chloroflexaceae bacterium]
MNAIPAGARRSVILVVDDEPANLRLLAAMLRDYHYDVRTVISGQMALRSATLDAPDVILLDVNMPQMSGYEVCQRLKADERTSDIPVIFLSALGEVMDKVRAFQVGGADYVTKPFQIEEVLARIDHQLTIRQAREHLRKLHQAVEQSPVAIIITDHEGNIEYVNSRFTRATGYPIEAVYGEKLWHLEPDALAPGDYQSLWEKIMAGEEWHGEHHSQKKNGERFWESVSISPIFNERGTITHVVAVKEDITERKQAEENLRRSNDRMAHWIGELKRYNREVTLLNGMGDSLQSCASVSDAYRIVERTASRLFEGQSGALYILNATGTLFEAVARWGDDQSFVPTIHVAECPVRQGGRVYTMTREFNEAQCSWFNPKTMYSCLCLPLMAQESTFGMLRLVNGPLDTQEDYEHWLGLALMMTDNLALALANLQLRERLREQSIRDPLTGLFNRRYLDSTIGREIDRANRYHRSIGVIMADIDHFKQFNDTYGHDAGDALLRAVGAFFQSNIRSEDIACRYGGEEFVLILPDASLTNTQERAETLLRGIHHLKVAYGGMELDTVTMSMGVASMPEHGIAADTVIKTADVALYRAKRAGRNRVVVADHAINQEEARESRNRS